jgi:hypothetical protein
MDDVAGGATWVLSGRSGETLQMLLPVGVSGEYCRHTTCK